MFVLNKLCYGTQMHLLNLSLYKYSSLLYLDTANSGECDIKEREKAEWWGDLTLNANTIVTGDHLYKGARCVVSCAYGRLDRLR